MGKSKSEIGILGLGNRSTLFYIDQLNKAYNALHGGYSTCPFVLSNEDFNLFNPYLPDNFEKLKPALSAALNRVSDLNIDLLVIPNITLHQTFDQLNHTQKIAHPLQLTAAKLNKNNYKSAFIFGTAYTMQSNYIQQYFYNNGIELLNPKSEDMAFIDYFRKQVYEGKETEKEIQKFNDLKTAYKQKHPVVIGCTELSLYGLEKEERVYDMVLIQLAEALFYLPEK